MFEQTPDKRSYSRVSVECDILLTSTDLPALPVTNLNLSASGIYCVSSRSLGELTKVDIILQMPRGEEIAARAVVIREEEFADGSYGLGLLFTRIAEEDRDLMLKYTSRRNMSD